MEKLIETKMIYLKIGIFFIFNVKTTVQISIYFIVNVKAIVKNKTHTKLIIKHSTNS